MIRITVIIFERLWDNLSKYLFNQTLLLKWHKPWMSVEARFSDTEAVNLSDKPNFSLMKINLNTKLHNVKLLNLKQMLWNVTENVRSKTFKPTFKEFGLLCKRILGFYHNRYLIIQKCVGRVRIKVEYFKDYVCFSKNIIVRSVKYLMFILHVIWNMTKNWDPGVPTNG